MSNKKMVKVTISENEIKTIAIPMNADPELYVKQVEFEHDMREAGATRFMNRTRKAIESGREDETSYGRRIVGTQIQSLAKAIEEMVTSRMKAGQAARGCAATPILAEYGKWEQLAYLTLKQVASAITRPNPMSKVCTRIGAYIEDEMRCINLREKDKRAYTSMRKAVKKKGDYRKKRATEIYINRANNIEWSTWDDKTRFKVGLLLLDTLMNSLPEFVEVRMLTSNTVTRGKTKTQKYICPTQETLDWIRENKEHASLFSPIYEPMIVPPVRWSTGRVVGGGYVSNYVPPLKMVKSRNKYAVERFKEADMPAVIKSLNAVQETAWRIRKPILEIVENAYRNKIDIGSLTNLKTKDLPPQPNKEQFPDEHKAWRSEAKHVYEHNMKMVSRLANIGQNIMTARKYAEFDAIYMPYQLDFRGRVYCVTQLSPQGEDYVKGLLEFSEGKPLADERGVYWLFVHVANLFGVDKVSFDDRVKWVKDNMKELLACAEDPYECRFWEEADKPFQALAACYELQGYAKDGYAHVCHMPVALDGSCSGLQNLGMALACEITGKSVNLIPADKPADIYQEVANKVNAMLAEACEYESIKNGVKTIDEVIREAVRKHYFANANKPSEKKWLNFWNKLQTKLSKRNDDELYESARKVYSLVRESYAWLVFGVDRKVCKRSVMTFPYGSKKFGFQEQVMEDTLRPAKAKLSEDKWPFMEDGHAAAGVLATFLYDAVQRTVLKAAEAMDWMQQSARMVAKQGKPVSWVTPLGFPVLQEYRKLKMKMVETHLNGTRYQLSIPTDSLDIDVMKSANSISPNVCSFT